MQLYIKRFSIPSQYVYVAAWLELTELFPIVQRLFKNCCPCVSFHHCLNGLFSIPWTLFTSDISLNCQRKLRLVRSFQINTAESFSCSMRGEEMPTHWTSRLDIKCHTRQRHYPSCPAGFMSQSKMSLYYEIAIRDSNYSPVTGTERRMLCTETYFFLSVEYLVAFIQGLCQGAQIPGIKLA